MDSNWLYASAKSLLQAMQDGALSSRQLLELYIKRIEQKNAEINAVVATDLEAARKRADAADAARANGELWGPLHGLPMTIKDTYEVPGMPCTAGAPMYRNHQPSRAAVAVQKLIDAGAIIFGKTNVPLFASDLQSYNKIYGTTNNPWNKALTPGGSSGGAAAALAAGFTAAELGSDIGGSIRTPAHFCGVYGHKVTHGIISMRGHVPGPPGTLGEPDLAVAGPMARAAGDLALLLDVVAGASPAE
ncbi:MAG TPA: amidase family protein, partial [Pseudomonadales bacterium]|nr:amidase family protein [Pseudomonadales bacterium]